MSEMEMTAMTDGPRDNPGVVIMPPLLLLIIIISGLVLDWLAPLGLLSRLPPISRGIAGAILMVLGIGLAAGGRARFLTSGTNVKPYLPATVLVTSGAFERLRNPMYVGWTIALIGFALISASDWILALMVPGLLVLHYGVVLREERYLERKFGEPYRAYKASVPRYGWRF
jgi:protein-S-isoprenylcysteine O-methyltransferase Ste14